jgi:hypothetical protein
MNEIQTFRTRLRVRLGKALTSDELVLAARIGGREVEIKSQTKDETLRKAKWVVFTAGGFDSEVEAQAFGEQLRTIAGIVGICTRLGIDIGEDHPTSWINEEWARSIGLIKQEERIHPNVHGLMVYPDDGLSRIAVSNAEAVVTSDPTQVIQAVEGLGESLPITVSIAEAGVRILNLALMSAEPLTQVVLAISVIEALGQDETWTENQRAILSKLADNLESSDDANPVNNEIADALRRSVHRIGLRQGVLRVLAQLELGHLKKEWDRLYNMRSGVFHGTQRLTESEMNQLAQDSITFCGKVVISLLTQEGIGVPAIAETHYPKESSEE